MKTLFRVAGVAALVTASVASGITAANAAPSCPTARVCLYDNYWFTGTQRTFGWVVSNVGQDANDKASSLVVGPAADARSPYVYFYQHDNFRGEYKLIYRGGNANNDLRSERMYTGWNWDDEISSVWG